MTRPLYDDIADRLSYAELRHKRRWKTVALAYAISQWVAGALVILIWSSRGEITTSQAFQLLIYAPVFVYFDLFMFDFGSTLMVLSAQTFVFACVFALLWSLKTRDLHEFCETCRREITDDETPACPDCGTINQRRRLARRKRSG